MWQCSNPKLNLDLQQSESCNPWLGIVEEFVVHWCIRVPRQHLRDRVSSSSSSFLDVSLLDFLR